MMGVRVTLTNTLTTFNHIPKVIPFVTILLLSNDTRGSMVRGKRILQKTMIYTGNN
jgi:hypothetical protein